MDICFDTAKSWSWEAPQLTDCHCHLDFMSNGEDVARAAEQAGTRIFCNTVTPAGFLEAKRRFGSFANVSVGLGMHPWWVTDDADVLEQAISLVESTRFIGEIGLDFGRRGAQSASAQVPVFKEIMTHAARQGGKVISIHAIKSADTVLNVLETSGALDTCACIMHWFSGTSQDLDRARKDGCLFSVNPMMVQSRRGREYVRQIPSGQLLLETDAPPGENVPFAYDQLAAALSNTQREIKAIKQHR